MSSQNKVKILVVSDTHENTSELEKIIARHADEVRLVCHLGDHARDLLRLQEKFPSHDFVAISGNCDYGGDYERVLAFSPCVDSRASVARILLVHGHEHGVKLGPDRLAYAAMERGAGAAFFGHTHKPVATTYAGVFIMNPGSPSFPRGGSKASYGIAEISPEGIVSGRIFAV